MEHRALYFTTPGCGVCQSLQPKLKALFAEKYPQLSWQTVDSSEHPKLAARYDVFTVPVLIVELDQQVVLRLVRNFSLHELTARLDRLYSLRFSPH